MLLFFFNQTEILGTHEAENHSSGHTLDMCKQLRKTCQLSDRSGTIVCFCRKMYAMQKILSHVLPIHVQRSMAVLQIEVEYNFLSGVFETLLN